MNIAIFVLGVSVGIALYRFLIAMILEKSPDNICSHCEWLGRKNAAIKKRHK